MIRKRLEYSATLFDERYSRQDFLPFDSLEPEVVLQTCLQRTINFVTFDLINAILSYFVFRFRCTLPFGIPINVS